MPKARPIELFTVVGDDCVREVKLVDDVFPYEVLDFGGGDRSMGFGFDLLCKVVHCDDCKFELSLTLWHMADKVQSPLRKWPRTDHWGKRFDWLLWNRAKALARATLLYKLDGI